MKSIATPLNLAVIAALPLALSACDTIKHTFGLDHYSGDEWSVPNTPPLELPPDYNLMPPKPGAEHPNAVSPTAQAQKQIGAPAAVKSSSEGEMTLVAMGAGDTRTDPNIRTKVDLEAVNEASTLSKLTNLPKKAMDNIMRGTDPEVKPTPQVSQPAPVDKI